ncbi:MAG: VCBS repeat-containing protein, partial [Actinobacteria bacterium]|nr:VCBS repeat-containing protein [Actinomycetota bacterium]
MTPGATCTSSDDCADGQYCEPGLADTPTMDGGVPDGGTGDAGVCLGGASVGRCLDLPPRCPAGMPPAPGEICIRDCEYRPSVGMLDAVEQWAFEASTVESYAGRLDVWSTPAVGRVTDTNCDGVVDERDPPNVIFISGNANGSWCGSSINTDACKRGVLRALDGATGREIWSLRRPEMGSLGFALLSPAIGDLDHDGDMEVVVIDGEGYVDVIDHTGAVAARSDRPITGFTSSNSTGWGGGVSIADMDHDGAPEIAYGR